MPPESLAAILSALTWPVIVLIAIILFKSEIRGLLKRVQKAKLPLGAEASFGYGSATIDKAKSLNNGDEESSEPSTANHSPLESIRWANSGNLFWLAHDLVLTIDALLRNAPKETVLHDVRQSLHHLRELGFIDFQVEGQLAMMKSELNRMFEEDLTQSKRDDLAKELAAIIKYVGTLAETHQPDFSPFPREK